MKEQPDNEPTDLPPVYIRERMKPQERGGRRITAKELAEPMNTSEAQISRLLNGKRRMSLEWLYAFARALRVPIEELFSPPVTFDEREKGLHAALLKYGLFKEQLPHAMSMINGLAQDAERLRQSQSHDQSAPANPRREEEPSKSKSRQPSV